MTHRDLLITCANRANHDLPEFRTAMHGLIDDLLADADEYGHVEHLEGVPADMSASDEGLDFFHLEQEV